MTLAIQGPITRDPGPMTLAKRWPHDPGENVGRWPHVPGDRQTTLLTPTPTCNGSGACIPATVAQPCPGSLACASPTECRTSCIEQSTTGCPPGRRCESATCLPADLWCGDYPNCRVTDGGHCCVTSGPTQGSLVYTCNPPGTPCSTRSVIPCNGRKHCPSGQICCLTATGGSSLAGNWEVACVDPSLCEPRTGVAVGQVCDPTLPAPGECLRGMCHSEEPVPGSRLSWCY